jgi:hypothetical protein
MNFISILSNTLETAALLVISGVGAACILSAYRLWELSNAEHNLTVSMAEIAKQRHMMQRLMSLRESLLDDEIKIDKRALKDFIAILDESLEHMRGRERALLKRAVNQPSLIGKRNYEFKLLSKTTEQAWRA